MFPSMTIRQTLRRWFIFPLCLLIAQVTILTCTADRTDQATDLKILFDEKYETWLEYCRRPEVWSRSRGEAFVNNEPFREIVRMGIPILPYLMEKVESKPIEGRLLHFALTAITKKTFHAQQNEIDGQLLWTVEEFPDIAPGKSHPDTNILWLRWWREQVHRTPEQFEGLYGRWNAGAGSEETEAIYAKMLDLGIVALPAMINKVAAGDTTLIPAVSKLTGGAVPARASPAQCMVWWKKEGTRWTITPPG